MVNIIMNWKRGILLAVALWVLIFFEVSILMFGFKLSSTSPFYYFIHFLLLAVFVILLNYIYFKNKVKRGFLEGIYLGLLFVVIGITLDCVITIPLFIIPQGGSYSSFLISFQMLLGYFIVIIVSGLIAWMKKYYK